MQTITLDHLAAHTEDVLRSLEGTDEPLVVSLDGNPKAVIQDFEHYEKLRRGIKLWQFLSKRIQETKEEDCIPMDEAFDEIEKELDNYVEI